MGDEERAKEACNVLVTPSKRSSLLEQVIGHKIEDIYRNREASYNTVHYTVHLFTELYALKYNVHDH